MKALKKSTVCTALCPGGGGLTTAASSPSSNPSSTSSLPASCCCSLPNTLLKTLAPTCVQCKTHQYLFIALACELPCIPPQLPTISGRILYSADASKLSCHSMSEAWHRV